MDDLMVGSVVKGKVTGIENYGIFVKINDDYVGLIHISEISDKFVKNINDYVKIDEVIYVEILDLNSETKKCILSIKNINYRENCKGLTNESIRGFSPLKKHLPIWIDEKISVDRAKSN